MQKDTLLGAQELDGLEGDGGHGDDCVSRVLREESGARGEEWGG